MSFGDMDMSVSMYKNLTFQIVIGNPTDGELHIQYVVSIEQYVPKPSTKTLNDRSPAAGVRPAVSSGVCDNL
jgi:hypothetical protein